MAAQNKLTADGNSSRAVVDGISLSETGKEKAGKIFRKSLGKFILCVVGILLAILAVASAIACIQNFRTLPDVTACRDGGVRDFMPLYAVPVQEYYSVKIGAGWQERSRSKYSVVYSSADGYQYTAYFQTESEALEIVQNRQEIFMRVIQTETGGYYVIPEDESAESYFGGFRRQYLLTIVGAGVYLILFTLSVIKWNLHEAADKKADKAAEYRAAKMR